MILAGIAVLFGIGHAFSTTSGDPLNTWLTCQDNYYQTISPANPTPVDTCGPMPAGQ